jgi:hypothetical protein
VKINEVIKSIREVNDDWEGYEVTTNGRTIRVCISNSSCCCELWGHLSSDDDLQQYVGANLRSVTSVDKALNTKTDPGDIDEGTVYFVNFNTDRGKFQLAVYDAHNGYYGHSVEITGLRG